MTLYVGIDWGKASSVYAFGTVGNTPETKKVANTAAGLTGMCERLVELADGEPVVVAIEGGAPAVTTWLVAAGFAVHVVDGKQARRFVQSLTSAGSKNDKLDAFFGWHLAQSPLHLNESVEILSGADRALLLAVRGRDQLGKRVTRCINQLRAFLTELVPDIEQRLAKLTSQYARDLIRWVPTPWHAAQMTQAQWTQFLASHRVPHKKRAALWEAIAGDAQRTGFEESDARSVGETISILVDELERLLETDSRFDRTLRSLVDDSETATVIQTVEGIGTRLAANLTAAAFSDEQRARAERSVDPRDYATRLARCAPVQNQTGVSTNAVKRRRAGSDRAAAATIASAAQASMRIPWAKAMLRHRRSKGDGYYTALRKIGRSLLRIVRAMLRDGQPYDDALYVARLQAKGVSWAQTL